MTPSAGPRTHQSGKTVSPLTLPSPLLPAHSPALFLTSSPPLLPSLLPSIPHSVSSFTSLLNPLSSSWIPPFLHTPPFPHPYPNPLAPLFPISVSVCSYPADLCPSCRCWFAHPAPLANMTKRDPQYSNRHTAFKCRMAGSTWVQL